MIWGQVLTDTSEPISTWQLRGAASEIIFLMALSFSIRFFPSPSYLLWYHSYSNNNGTYSNLVNSRISSYWHIALLHSRANSTKGFSTLNGSTFNLRLSCTWEWNFDLEKCVVFIYLFLLFFPQKTKVQNEEESFNDCLLFLDQIIIESNCF